MKKSVLSDFMEIFDEDGTVWPGSWYDVVTQERVGYLRSAARPFEKIHQILWSLDRLCDDQRSP